MRDYNPRSNVPRNRIMNAIAISQKTDIPNDPITPYCTRNPRAAKITATNQVPYLGADNLLISSSVRSLIYNIL